MAVVRRLEVAFIRETMAFPFSTSAQGSAASFVNTEFSCGSVAKAILYVRNLMRTKCLRIEQTFQRPLSVALMKPSTDCFWPEAAFFAPAHDF
jgi:hypothetical protein